MRIVQIAVVSCLLLCAAATAAPARQAAEFRDRIAAIAGGSDTVARRQVITDYLEASGIDYHLEEFTFPSFSGTNIVAEVPASNSTGTLLLGAHYDRVAQGQGAVDNAASCAVLLGLLREFKSKPPVGNSIRAVFFDLEERGLIGSQAYIARHRSELPAQAVNLDIFGYGDTLFGNASAPDGSLAMALQQAAKESSMPVRWIAAMNQYPASDHRPMMTAGIETLGLALIDGAEIDAILQRAGPPPRIMTIIHTAEDTIDKIRTEDMEKAVHVLDKMLRLIDER